MAPQTKHSAASDLEEKPQTRWEKSHGSFGLAFSEPASAPGSALSTQKRNQPNLPPGNSVRVKNGQNPKEQGQLDGEGDKGALSLAWTSQTLSKTLSSLLAGSLGVSLASHGVPSPEGTWQGDQGSQNTIIVLKDGLETKQAQEGSGSLRNG